MNTREGGTFPVAVNTLSTSTLPLTTDINVTDVVTLLSVLISKQYPAVVTDPIYSALARLGNSSRETVKTANVSRRFIGHPFSGDPSDALEISSSKFWREYALDLAENSIGSLTFGRLSGFKKSGVK
jgi:hypothetical protein